MATVPPSGTPAAAGLTPETRLLHVVTNILRAGNLSPEKLTAIANTIDTMARSNVVTSVEGYQFASEFILKHFLEWIWDYSPLDAVVAFGQTCTYCRAAAAQYLVKRVDKLLQHWVSNGKYLRDIMKKTYSVISGSTVLSFILGVDWGTNDLDIYCPNGPQCYELIRYLKKEEGYVVEQTLPDGGLGHFEYNNAKISRVFKLGRTKEGDDTKKDAIDIIECLDKNALPAILRFHTSFVMNWIASDGIFVTYPKLTLAKSGLLNERIDITRPKQIKWMKKYRERGFKIHQSSADLGEPCGSACPTIWRNTHDVGCMVVSFREGRVRDLQSADWTLSKDGREIKRECRNPLCWRSHPGSLPIRLSPWESQAANSIE